MKKPLVILAILFGMCAISASAVDLSIEYLDGYLDIQEGGEWYELAIGETITDSDTVRLDENSVAELSGRGTKLTLTKPGVYVIADLIKASGETRSLGIAGVIGSKIRTIVEEPKQSQTAVMGVRGAKSEDELEWMSGDTAELLKSGKDYLAEGKFEDAAEVFEEAYDFADESEEDEVLFYLGFANALMGELRLAIGSIDDIDPDPSMEFFADLILLKGQLLTETFAYQEAVEWLGEYSDGLANDKSAAQMGYLLQGISHKGLGNSGNAKLILQKAVELDAASDAGKAAASLLQEL